MAFDNPADSVPILSFSLTIGLIAVIGNGIIIYIVLRFKQFRSSTCNFLMGLLAFSSFCEGTGLLLTGSYAFYREFSNTTDYNRALCLGLALPGIFGVISSQLTMLWMALDRFLAIRKPLVYFQSKSKVRLYVSSVSSITIGLLYALFAAYSKDTKSNTSNQCSTGASVSQIFIGAYAVFSLFMAISIFSVYITTLILFMKQSKIMDKNFATSLKTQRSVFISISLILLSYAIFWCLPMFVGIVVIIKSPTSTLLSYMSLGIALGSGLNSCVGIFIYLVKHQELKEYFLKIFPIFKKVPKKAIQIVAPMVSYSARMDHQPSRF